MSACIEFTGYIWKNGYGCKWYKGRSIGAHRHAWIMTYGDIPSGMLVCHKCDNRKCINPEHLFLGTHQDNLIDMCNKNRQGRGYRWKKKGYCNERHHATRLTDAQVKEIRERFVPRNNATSLANEFGTTRWYIAELIRGIKRPYVEQE